MTLVLIKILAVLFLVLANGFFVAVEFALVSVRRSRIETLAARGKNSAHAVLHALDHLDTLLSACQFGITLASLALGAVGESTLAHLIEPIIQKMVSAPASSLVSHSIAVAFALAIITYLHLVLGEYAPKAMAIEKAEVISLATARSMQLFYRTFKPFIWLINYSGINLLKIFGINFRPGHHTVYTDEELRHLITSGNFETEERELIHNVFEFSDLMARDVMIPRTKVVTLDLNSGFVEVVNQFQLSGYSRLPVYREKFDNIIGIVHSKDVMGFTLRPGEFNLQEIIRPPVFIPDSAKLGTVLSLMQRDRTHLAIIVDEHAGVEGILTLEDLLEEIVGEIEDEHDEAEATALGGENGLSLDAGLSVREANRKFNLNLPESDDYTTVAGFLISEAGRLLNQGDAVEHDGSRFTVERVASRRITQVKMERLP